MTAESPQIDLTSAQVSGSVNSGDLTNLPSGSRNFTQMVALLPGVVYNPAADSSSDSVTINGQNGSGVVYLMDGGSNNDDLRGGTAGAQAPALETIQEFRSSPTSSTPSAARPRPASSTRSPSRAPISGTGARSKNSPIRR